MLAFPAEPIPEPPDRHTCRAIREAAGLSRRALAERLGCHEQTIVNWELGTVEVGGRRMVPYLRLLATLDRETREREAAG